eukprot:5310157-Prymnesium_polylepis.1
MAFKSSEVRSAVAMVRDAEALGVVASATASRENIVYQVDTLKESVPAALEMLAETALSPKFLPWEVRQSARHRATAKRPRGSEAARQ